MTEILTIETVAELLHCDEKTVAERLLSGDLPGAKFGRGWIVPAQALFQRVNELAVEEAAARRRSAMPAPEVTGRRLSRSPVAVANESAPKKRGRARFIFA